MDSSLSQYRADLTQELQKRIHSIFPAGILVRERQLRKILHEMIDAGHDIPFTTHLPLWVDRGWLNQLGILPEFLEENSCDRIALLIEPEDWLHTHRLTLEQIASQYWRRIVQARIEEQLRSLPDTFAESRLAQIDQRLLKEIRTVLIKDHWLTETANLKQFYTRFTSIFLDLCLFHKSRIRWFFPSIHAQHQVEAIQSLLTQDLDISTILHSSRPAGATISEEHTHDDHGVQSEIETVDAPVNREALLDDAEQALRTGNHVRAAIATTKAIELAHKSSRYQLQKRSRAIIRDGMVPRLARVLHWKADQQKQWSEVIIAALPVAARRRWSRTGRALYDLQKIAVDLENEVSIVDPVGWLSSFGRRSLKRPLSQARTVILHHHFATAKRHLHKSSLNPELKLPLLNLIDAEMKRSEAKIRQEYTPILIKCLEDGGLIAQNTPELLARNKLVAELIDRICERGFFRFADLRDAISRNQLKLPDLAGPREFVLGDALLRIDHHFANSLDGVYRRGELYLRWIQRGSALAFGTTVGRWLSMYLLLPFGGALMIVEFAKYLKHEISMVYSWIQRQLLGSPGSEDAIGALGGGLQLAADQVHSKSSSLLSWESGSMVVLLGFLILALLYLPGFRSQFLTILHTVGSLLHRSFVTLPMRLWRSSTVQLIRKNPVVKLITQRFGTSLFVCSITLGVVLLIGVPFESIALQMLTIFGLLTILLNTSLGRKLEDDVMEFLSDSWRDVRVSFIPGVISWLIAAFRELAGWLEQQLYAVDEWLRFREGQSQSSLLFRAILATLWFPIAYLARFVFYLLLEPQVNPLKHFPVVTVSHKLLLPMIPMLADATGVTKPTMTAIVSGIPGIFGFIAWELKENWRLYAANRPSELSPVILGHHGETMRGLLRPGFHSGTVPATYRKMRTAMYHADQKGTLPDLHRACHTLDEVAHALQNYVEREGLAILRMTKPWQSTPIEVGHPEISLSKISLELVVPLWAGPHLLLRFELHDDTIHSDIRDPAWLSLLSRDQQETLFIALRGLQKMGASELPNHEMPVTTWPNWLQFWDRFAVAKTAPA